MSSVTGINEDWRSGNNRGNGGHRSGRNRRLDHIWMDDHIDDVVWSISGAKTSNNMQSKKQRALESWRIAIRREQFPL